MNKKLAEIEAEGQGSATRIGRENWVKLCLCGHLENYHGTGTGAPPRADGDEIHGCRGAIARRNDPPGRYDRDRRIMVFEATCPCRKFRHVADVDRPGRLFRQQVWTTRDEIHPMIRGLRALKTRMTNAKMIDDPEDEVERRFRRIPGRWVCRVCKADDDSVWPTYVSDNRHSQMRCENHTKARTPSLYGPQQDDFSYEWPKLKE